MGGRGQAPKPAYLRQRRNKVAGVATLEVPDAPGDIPVIPNPDGRKWHELTLKAWEKAWRSPMATQWLESDVDTLGRLAVLWDAFYKGATQVLGEVRLQEQRFGLSPLDRNRLQWEIKRPEAVESPAPRPARRTGTHDPRAALMSVVK